MNSCTVVEKSVTLPSEDNLDGRAERAAANPSLGERMRNCPSSRQDCLISFYFYAVCQSFYSVDFQYYENPYVFGFYYQFISAAFQ